MIVYATNKPEIGYEFMGSFNSVEEAYARMGNQHFTNLYWYYGDKDDDPAPEWIQYKCD